MRTASLRTGVNRRGSANCLRAAKRRQSAKCHASNTFRVQTSCTRTAQAAAITMGRRYPAVPKARAVGWSML